MLNLLYNYYVNILYNGLASNDYVRRILDNVNFDIGGYNVAFGSWLAFTASIISITIIVVLCCLFIYKIIKLIGGLIR